MRTAPLTDNSGTAQAQPLGPHAWCMVAGLYVTQGLPLGMAMDAMPTVLRSAGMPLTVLAWLPLVGLPWVLKFLWASQVDNRWWPAIGRRRSWIVPMQSLVLACMLAMAALGMEPQTAPWIVVLAVLGSLASATQDIATDALVAEQFKGDALPRANALQVGGTMVGFFLGGAGCMVLAGWLGQRAAMLALCLPVAASLALAGSWREPSTAFVHSAAARASLRAFVRSEGAWPLLAVALLSAMAAASGFGLAKLFLVDAQWSMQQVGTLGMASGAVTIVLGCGAGAWLVRSFGARRIFLLGVALAGCGALLWALMAARLLQLSAPLAFAASALGSAGAGALSVALMTAAMRLASRRQQAGTDMTAVQSTRDLGEIATSSSLISLAAMLGFEGSFGVVALLACVALAVGVRARALEA